MKRIIVIIFILFLFISPSLIFAVSDSGWSIKNFESAIEIEKNQKVKITETIIADFGNLEKHGIYREIPYKYSRSGNNYNVRLKIISITDANNKNIQYEESCTGGNITLKIGDPDKTVDGEQIYKITYELNRVINHFDSHDEFYWNVTGNDWPVAIKSSKTTITWPEDAEFTQNVCYTGVYGSTQKNCDINKVGDINNIITFTTDQNLNPGEGFTIVSGIKPGVLQNYSALQGATWFLVDNWVYLIPIIVLLLLLLKYFKSGKDPKGQATIVPEFDVPDKLKPAELGTVLDERVDTQDISAIIIDLAVRGFIKIKEIDKKVLVFTSKDYEFISTKKDESSLGDYEKTILHELCGSDGTKKLSNLKETFYVHVKEIKDKIYDKTTSEGYFQDNPEKTRNKYLIIGFVLLFFGGIIVSILMPTFNTTGGIFAFIASGLLFIIFSFLMTKRTKKGVEALRKIKGFKLYMNTAERYRQKFNEDEHIFEKLLPYAMVFGIVKKWAKAFEGVQVSKPTWYEGQGAFYPMIFASNISSLQNTMNSNLISPPSKAGAGGSGFSGGGAGGGFGGGGGGSW